MSIEDSDFLEDDEFEFDLIKAYEPESPQDREVEASRILRSVFLRKFVISIISPSIDAYDVFEVNEEGSYKINDLGNQLTLTHSFDQPIERQRIKNIFGDLSFSGLSSSRSKDNIMIFKLFEMASERGAKEIGISSDNAAALMFSGVLIKKKFPDINIAQSIPTMELERLAVDEYLKNLSKMR